MKRNELMQELQKGLSDLLAAGPAAEIERNVKAFMTQAFTRMDLITREEFDIQVQILERLRERINTLEQVINELEQRLPSTISKAASKKRASDQ